jgi:hypothetical protein
MGVRKQDAAGCQPIKIGRDRLWMSVQATNPVVEVVHCDEEDIWRLL